MEIRHYHNRLLITKASFLLILLVLCRSNSLFAQATNIRPGLLKGGWSAHWIDCPDVPARSYGIFHFRKSIELTDLPKHFTIHVSADNRYILYVNGILVGRGSARSSLYNWNFETYDIARLLKPGANVLAAKVWNMGEYAPVAQISNQTGFLMQGDTKIEEVVNTDNSWKVLHDTAYQPCAVDAQSILKSYFVVGPGDAVSAKAFPWGWEKPDFKDVLWKQANIINTPVVPSGYGTDNLWTLSPRTIPPMASRTEPIGKIVRTIGIKTSAESFDRKQPVIIPANSHVSLLIDHGFESIGYPGISVSGGEGAMVKLTYAESLFDKKGQKGNRNVIDNKSIKGLYDVFYPDGHPHRTFSPLWVRTFRYLQIDIQTDKESLAIDSLHSIYTAYPFVRKATFSSSDTSLQSIWKVGWRTARLCAGETYFDCPYYEQLQYEGDTRIQALISLYNTGDDRLVRKAINDFYLSRTPDGLTQGRYPSSRLQVIPPFSLWWVSMLYDYWMLGPDTAFVEKYLPAATQVLDWYEQQIDHQKQMLGPMKWWNFVDWNPAFGNGVPDGAVDGNSAVITLQYALALKQAAKVFNYFGKKQKAGYYLELSKTLAKSTYEQCFDASRQEMANTPEKASFSQHAGILAILADAVPDNKQPIVLQNIISDTSLSKATFYYRFYLTRAMIKAGKANDYYSQLTPWRDMLKIGLTTFAEKPEPTRSDCHAWSASPIYDFLATICGIMPDAPGFKKVLIQPALGALTEINGSMPSPLGMISVQLKRKHTAAGIEGEVTLPAGLVGKFVWADKSLTLHGGSQRIDME